MDISPCVWTLCLRSISCNDVIPKPHCEEELKQTTGQIMLLECMKAETEF